MKLKKETFHFNNGSIEYEYFIDEQYRCQGEYKSYWPNGKLRCIGFYKDGEWHGKWTFYNEDGSLYRIIYWWEDREVSKSEFVFRSKL